MYKSEKSKKWVCNRCGRELSYSQDLLKEGVCTVEVTWGYFSRKDGEHHRFCLCEDCYDDLVKTFLIPVQVEEKTELL